MGDWLGRESDEMECNIAEMLLQQGHISILIFLGTAICLSSCSTIILLMETGWLTLLRDLWFQSIERSGIDVLSKIIELGRNRSR